MIKLECKTCKSEVIWHESEILYEDISDVLARSMCAECKTNPNRRYLHNHATLNIVVNLISRYIELTESLKNGDLSYFIDKSTFMFRKCHHPMCQYFGNHNENDSTKCGNCPLNTGNKAKGGYWPCDDEELTRLYNSINDLIFDVIPKDENMIESCKKDIDKLLITRVKFLREVAIEIRNRMDNEKKVSIES